MTLFPSEHGTSGPFPLDSCGSVFFLIIPGGCTSIIQPMDKCINKTYMRQEWEEWIKQDRPVPTTKAGNLDWVSRALASSDHSAFLFSLWIG